MRYSQQSVVQGLVWMHHADISEWHVCRCTSLPFPLSPFSWHIRRVALWIPDAGRLPVTSSDMQSCSRFPFASTQKSFPVSHASNAMVASVLWQPREPALCRGWLADPQHHRVLLPSLL